MKISLGTSRDRPEYIMAHSLAHALMTEVAIDCGYPASALKERIYVLPTMAGEPLRCGLLIYTATAGHQGTLGGLVEVTCRFHRVLGSALERLRLCSGDPVCADHDPASADEDRMLHGAACHGCLLIAETSTTVVIFPAYGHLRHHDSEIMDDGCFDRGDAGVLGVVAA